MAKCHRQGTAGFYHARTESCIHCCIACSQLSYGCKRVYSADPGVQKQVARAMRRAQVVAGGVNTTLSEDEQGIVLNEPGAPPASSITVHLFTDAVAPRTSCSHGQIEDPEASVGGAASRQGVTSEQVTSHRSATQHQFLSCAATLILVAWGQLDVP